MNTRITQLVVKYDNKIYLKALTFELLVSTHVESHFGHGVVAVLVDDALGLLEELVGGLLLPPVVQVSLEVELATLGTNRRCYFVSLPVIDRNLCKLVD